MPSRGNPDPDPIEIARLALEAINGGQTQKGLALALVSLSLQLPAAQQGARSLASSLEENVPGLLALANALGER